MMSKQVLTAAVVIGVLAAMPAFAQEGRQGRSRGADRGGARVADGRAVSRAVPRAPQGRTYAAPPRTQAPPRAQAYRNRGVDRRGYAPGYANRGRPAPAYVRPGYAVPRPPVARGYVAPRRVSPRYVAPRYAPRGYYAPGYRGYVAPGYRYYGPGRGLAPRFIAPRIVTVLPYRPYYYRPRLGLNLFYGAGGGYPFGYTPRGFYDPLPDRIYGGVRITDAPREAQVFVDGYYAGIVDDFDGAFQHVNLEAGEHRIEVHAPGLEPIAFDVMVQPGRTITLRAEIY